VGRRRARPSGRALRRATRSETSSAPARVTVVIATRDRAGALDRTLHALRSLPERPSVIVVDNGSTDRTAAVVAAHGRGVRCIALGHNLGAAARNVGVARATTPYVALCDDDSWWAPGALARAAEHLRRAPALGLVAARLLVGPERRLDPLSRKMVATPLPCDDATLPGVPVLGFAACGAILRREAYLQAGGFHPRFGIGGEEDLLAIDLADGGWALRYCDDVVAFHHPSTPRDPRARERRIARNRLWTAWLRRPSRSAARTTRRAVRRARHDAAVRAGIREAVAGWHWTVRERRVVRPEIDEQLRLLEATAG
jgi:GT2 family glycosyltransferase